MACRPGLVVDSAIIACAVRHPLRRGNNFHLLAMPPGGMDGSPDERSIPFTQGTAGALAQPMQQ